MNDFVYVILHYAYLAIPPIIICTIFGIMFWAQVYRWIHKEERDFPWRKIFPVGLLIGYLSGLLFVTLFLRSSGNRDIQWHLFLAFREAWNAFTFQSWLNPLLNIIIFIPMGSLLPLVAQPFRRWYWTLVAGMSTSFVIETVQYTFRRGTADVDDLFCNSLGTILGYCLCMFVICLVEKKWAVAGICIILPVMSVTTLLSVFIEYYTQPYGNLADAPCFAANTSNVEWVLKCELSDKPGATEIYWVEPFTKETCDEFALSFAQRRGVDITGDFFDIDYYDNTAYYSDHSTFSIIVNYNDRTYNYTDSRVDMFAGWGMATEANLRNALEDLRIDVPEDMEFIDKGMGQYIFWADRIKKNSSIINGELCCKVAKDGTLYSVNNHLSVGAFCGEVAIISETEAYDRLSTGQFNRMEASAFENLSPKTVHVTACKLQYIADTKGFLQPVYYFSLSCEHAAEGWRVFVPAIAH